MVVVAGVDDRVEWYSWAVRVRVRGEVVGVVKEDEEAEKGMDVDVGGINVSIAVSIPTC